MEPDLIAFKHAYQSKLEEWILESTMEICELTLTITTHAMMS